MVTGVVEATNKAIALQLLSEQGLTVFSLKKKWEFPFWHKLFTIVQGVGRREVVIFSRQLSIMISANVPLVQALHSIAHQTPQANFKFILNDIANEVDGGAKFSQGLARYPEVFDDLYVNIVRSGETSGRLETILNYIADEQEKEYDLIRKTKGFLIYPAIIFMILVAVLTMVVVMVIPKLSVIFEEAQSELPLVTTLLLKTTGFIAQYWWMIIAGLVLIYLAYHLYTSREEGALRRDHYKLKIPVIGNLMQKIYLVRFARSLGVLVVGGVPIENGLKIVAEAVGNLYYRDLILRTAKEVEDGNAMSAVFSEYPTIPAMVTQMLHVGEESGKVDVVLDKIADFYSHEVDNSLHNIVNLIEPLVIIVMGLGVGILYTAVIMPMYQLANQL